MMWMILFLLLPLAGLAYVGWHVWTLVPLSAVWRTVIVGVGVLSFCMIFLNFTRVIDRLPLWLARWSMTSATQASSSCSIWS